MEYDLKIFALGGLSFLDKQGELIGMSSRKAEAILIYALLSEKISIEREELATLLWEEMDEQKALTNLRVTLAKIKQDMGDVLIISRRRISINPDWKIFFDYLVVKEILRENIDERSTQDEISLKNARNIKEALAYYKGDLLQGFYVRKAIEFEDWLTYQRENLKTQVINAVHLAVQSFYQNGDFISGVEAANQLIRLDPYNDAAYQWLIKLFGADGKRDAAIDAFNAYVQMLQEGLGLDADEDVINLIGSIKSGSFTPDIRPEKINAKYQRPVPNNIPLQITKFFGREKELTQLIGSLKNSRIRLVTLLGQGGVGKTRLAVQTAKRLQNDFPDGVWFIPLAGVVSPKLVLPEIYQTLQIAYPEKSESIQQLVSYLNGNKVLIVLDNFEQLLDASAIISDVIRQTENSKFIITSREMTGLPEETRINLEGLSLETIAIPKEGKKGSDNRSAASAMFHDWAKRIDADYDDTAENQAVVDEICKIVAGMPLGIELAVTGLKHNSLMELRDKLQEDVFSLKSDHPEIPERQRSLTAVFNTFWSQMSENEQNLLCRLSVFRRVVTRKAAAQVAGVSSFFLSNLVSRGLLQRAMPEGYQAHSMHRRYVYNKLKENPKEFKEIHEKHHDYYFAYLSQLERSLRDNPEKDYLDTVEFELNNIRTALHFVIQGKDEQTALEFCEMLMPFWKIRGYYQEGYHWYSETFQLKTNANLVMKSAALCAAAKLATKLGDFDIAQDFSKESLKYSKKMGDQHGEARALNSLGAALAASGKIDQAGSYFSESLVIYRNLRVQQAIAGTLVNLAAMQTQEGELETAQRFLEEALTTFRTVGDTIGIIHVLHGYARIDLLKGNFEQAYAFMTEALQLAWKLSAKEELVRNYILLANYHLLRDEYKESLDLMALADSIMIFHNLSLQPSDHEDYLRIKSNVEQKVPAVKLKRIRTEANQRAEQNIIGRYIDLK